MGLPGNSCERLLRYGALGGLTPTKHNHGDRRSQRAASGPARKAHEGTLELSASTCVFPDARPHH